MKKRTVIKCIAEITAVILLAVSGVENLGAENLFYKATELSLISVLGKTGVKESEPTVLPLLDSNENEMTVTEPMISAPLTAKSITAAVREETLGNILKKTLSPYGANTSYAGVYLSNRSGAEIDIAENLASPLGFDILDTSEPQILIYHTHATEGYMADESEYYTDRDEPRSTDKNENVIRIGEIIAEELRTAGFAVVHDETLHDYPGYTGSYTRSAETVEEMLLRYPSIKIAIDVHRDSISSGKSDKVAPTVNIDGKNAAQVMLVMGSETGGVENYPNWRSNLKLAVKLQYIFELKYPQFARAILLKSSRYNQHLSKGSILIEVGSDANTLEEAEYSASIVGKSLVLLLKAE